MAVISEFVTNATMVRESCEREWKMAFQLLDNSFVRQKLFSIETCNIKVNTFMLALVNARPVSVESCAAQSCRKPDSIHIA